MDEDEYEIMPHSSLRELRKEVEALKKGKTDTTSQSVTQLQESIDHLIKLFKIATREMRIDEIKQKSVEKELGPLNKKIDTLIQQNQELAEGLVVVADMIKEKFPELEKKMEELAKGEEEESSTRFSSSSFNPPPPQPSLEPLPPSTGKPAPTPPPPKKGMF